MCTQCSFPCCCNLKFNFPLQFFGFFILPWMSLGVKTIGSQTFLKTINVIRDPLYSLVSFFVLIIQLKRFHAICKVEKQLQKFLLTFFLENIFCWDEIFVNLCQAGPVERLSLELYITKAEHNQIFFSRNQLVSSYKTIDTVMHRKEHFWFKP